VGYTPQTTDKTKLHLMDLPASEIIDSEAGKGFIEAYEQQI
jgi:hypothetical protein